MVAPRVKCSGEIAFGVARPDQLAVVRAPIIDGLTRRWKVYDPSFNPDLESFESSYRFALVLVATCNEELVGCGILVRESPRVARIVRMSVAFARQRSGIGSKVLGALLEHAAARGDDEVVLETSAAWSSAVAFYSSRGFEFSGERDGDQHVRRKLAANR